MQPYDPPYGEPQERAAEKGQIMANNGWESTQKTWEKKFLDLLKSF